MKSFYIRTFGCKLNQSDSASIRGPLLANGMREAQGPEEADLIVVNTCTVTHRADQGARQAIRKLRTFSPGATLVVTGCYAQREAGLLEAMPEVDRVFSLENRGELFKFVAGIIPENIDFGGSGNEANFGEKSRAFLKVQEGCNMKCSYCVIRLVRGKGRSLEVPEVIRRIQLLAEKGYEEVVLTGIHLGLWGFDLGYTKVGEGLFQLLSAIDRAENIPGIRLNSVEPYILRDDILQLIGESPNFAKHLHLSVQSGSPAILKKMRRHPDIKKMHHVLAKAREQMPLCGIGADIIVGFPGETEEDFQQTLDLMTGGAFSYGHVFPFSSRPGTEAAAMKDPVPSREIKKRSEKLRKAMELVNLDFRKKLVGKEISAIMLDQKDEEGRAVCLSDNFVHLSLVREPEASIKSRILVKIVAASPEATLAEAVS